MRGADRIAKARGWAWYGNYTIARLSAENPPRQGVSWNTKESCDLIAGYFAGKTIQQLAYYHGRTEGAILSQLGYVQERADTRSFYAQCQQAVAAGQPAPTVALRHRPSPPSPSAFSSKAQRRAQAKRSGRSGYAQAGRRYGG